MATLARDASGHRYYSDCGHAGAVHPVFRRRPDEAGAGTVYRECAECASRRRQAFEHGLGRNAVVDGLAGGPGA